MQLKEPHETYGHSFDEFTRLYLLPVRIFPEADGSCPLPENTVDFPPTQKAGPSQMWRINEARSAWELIADHRGAMLWDKHSGAAVLNQLEAGDPLPDDVTNIRPNALPPEEPLMNRWSELDGAWHLVPDYSRMPVWDKATGAVLPMLSPGEPLPATATALPPPRQGGGPWQYNDVLNAWEPVPPTPIPVEIPVPPDYSNVRTPS